MVKKQKRKEGMLALLDAIGESIELMTLSQHYQRAFVHDGFEGVRRARDAALRRDLRLRLAYLKKKKWIQESRRGERLIYALTDEGRRRLLRSAILKAPPRKDGLITVVIFDIPESEKTVRVFFRRFLKEVGFRKIQQSVWGIDKNFGNALAEFVRIHKLSPWINIIEGRLLLRKDE